MKNNLCSRSSKGGSVVLVHEAWRETSESDAVEWVEPQSVQPLDEVDRAKLEEVLVRRAIQGDSDAVVKLYESYFESVYAYFYRRVGSVSEVEDLTAETFTRAVQALLRGHYEWQGKLFGAWLLGIASKVFHEWLRHLKTMPLVEELGSVLVRGDLVSGEPGPLESVVQSEKRDALWQLVEELPLVECRVLILRYVYGLSYVEIAERLNRSEVACKQIHYRALKKLRRKVLESQL
jgi:RNA polymerase sigma factor (sigma-70 family)